MVDELADRIARFLAEHPLPAVARELDDLRAGAGATYGIGVEDVALLRRLVLRRCVYGVDLSPMGAEIAKISLWLASFVPGLSLSYLDHNVRVGNSLIGVASVQQLMEGGSSFAAMLVLDQIERAANATEELHSLLDRNPEEVARSEVAQAAVECSPAHPEAGKRPREPTWPWLGRDTPPTRSSPSPADPSREQPHRTVPQRQATITGYQTARPSTPRETQAPSSVSATPNNQPPAQTPPTPTQPPCPRRRGLRPPHQPTTREEAHITALT